MKEARLSSKLLISKNRGFTHFTKHEMPLCHFTGHNFWLLKPTNLNRGRGIHVFSDLKSLRKLIEEYCKGVDTDSFNIEKQGTKSKQRSSPGSKFPDYEPIKLPSDIKVEAASKRVSQYKKKVQLNNFIIQKYIEKPLLIYKRKFDIRVWVMVSHTGKCYFFKEGYLRTSGSEFFLDENNPDDLYVHLTNNAIQKYSKSYGEFEDGNQMSFKSFQNYINQSYPDK